MVHDWAYHISETASDSIRYSQHIFRRSPCDNSLARGKILRSTSIADASWSLTSCSCTAQKKNMRLVGYALVGYGHPTIMNIDNNVSFHIHWPSFATQQRKVPATFQDCSGFSGRAFSCPQPQRLKPNRFAVGIKWDSKWVYAQYININFYLKNGGLSIITWRLHTSASHRRMTYAQMSVGAGAFVDP